MVQDAKFEDGAEQPLRLRAEDADDLVALSAMLQDAVLPVSEMDWQAGQRRFGLLANRFRWEDAEAAQVARRSVERVQAVLVVDSVLKVRSSGLDISDKDQVISLLSVTFEPADDGAGTILLTLAGDGAIALDVECVDVTLKDVTRPYVAPSGKTPTHPS
ncbi:DUF2948 family protein [Neptunicoccus sediminis]|uniref:DUF2948 family protein n=1 Tax=Neptunicoccus sediminis TaxID=1892596 RepID=UPI000845D51E|nr:DUF2948 family protein [Neptunicoccus sediminis]